MRSNRLVPSLAVVLCLACGGGGSSTGVTGGARTETGGGEVTAPALGPVLSFVPDDARVTSRIDVARIRRSPVGPDIAGAIQASESYQTWARGSGLDPVADLDAVLLAGPALYADRRVILLRTVGDEARARDLVLRIGVARGLTPEWREERGFAVASYPDPALVVPHVIVLTASHEVVIAPEDDLGRILDVAADHARRRTSPDEIVDPALAFGDGEVMSLTSDDAMPTYAGYPTPPERFTVLVHEDATTGRTQIHIHGGFASEADAATAHTWLSAQAVAMADQLLVRMAQLDRPLNEVHISHTGAELDAETDFTSDELRRALGAIALYQASAAARE